MVERIKKSIKEIFQTATLRQSAITFSGTFVNGTLGAIFYIISARFLGPSAFGLMMLAITTLTLIADISDLGTNTGIVKFVAEYLKKDKTKAFRFLKLGLKVKFVILTVVSFIGFFIAPLVAIKVFSKPEFVTPLRISFIGVSSALLFSFSISSLQAFQRFWAWSGLQIGTNFLRLIILLFLIWLGRLSLNSNLVVYVVVPLLGFAFSFLLIKPDFLKVKKETLVTKEFFHYNKWVAAFSLIAALGARVDTFISGRLLSAAQLGIYTAVSQLVQIVPQLVVAIDTVVAPKMAAMGSIKELVSYIKKVQFMVLALAFLGIMFIPLIIIMIPLLYGSEYISSVSVFIILFLSMMIFLISIPIHMSIFYYFAKPSLFFWLSLGHLFLVSFASFILIPRYGVIGPAVSVLMGQVFDFIIPLVWVLKKLNSPSTINH